MSHNGVSTQVYLIKADSAGLKGTIAQARHHAQELLPFITALRPVITELGFESWLQGVRVHQLNTVDGRSFTLRGYGYGDSYVGIKLFARVSRSQEFALLEIDHISKIGVLIDMLKELAVPHCAEWCNSPSHGC